MLKRSTHYGLNTRFENNIVLTSVRRGLILMIPPLLVGSFALIILSFPVDAYQEFMISVFGDQWGSVLYSVRDGTFNIMSLLMVLCISYAYAFELKGSRNADINPVIVAVITLCSFMAFTGVSNPEQVVMNFGTLGVFLAIAVSVTAAWIFTKLSALPALKIRAFADGAEPSFNDALSAIIPAAMTISLFALLNLVLHKIFNITSYQQHLSDFFTHLFARMDSSLASGLLFILMVHVFWFLGMHGSNILEPVAQTVFVTALETNKELISHAAAPSEIFTKTFFDSFVLMGGSGSTLCLIAAIFICSRLKNVRRHAKLSAFPSLFNINELVVFGMPIVLNPVYFIPFIGVPLLLTIISFLAMRYGFVPYTTQAVEWTSPALLSGFVATGSLKGSILQVINLALGILCYIPFVRINERWTQNRIKQNIEDILTAFKHNEERGIASSFLTRYDNIGNTAKFLIADLEHDLQNGRIELFYQPQVDYRNHIFGVEALLRWKHPSYGHIYPPLVIALAEEAGMMDRLGYYILDTACRDLNRMHSAGFDQLVVSVNISSKQLESANFLGQIKEVLARHGIAPDLLKLEITEQLALSCSKIEKDRIKGLKDIGVKLAMDDFGMGHSSLLYLKEHEFETVKLDGALTREIVTNPICGDIIASIIYLSKSLAFTIIAEYVEFPEQKEKLYELGCSRYQGYLYSPAVDYDELIRYLSASAHKPL